jgi:hypothetical protein
MHHQRGKHVHVGTVGLAISFKNYRAIASLMVLGRFPVSKDKRAWARSYVPCVG